MVGRGGLLRSFEGSFYIINIINICLVVSLQQVEDEGAAEVLGA